MRIGFGATRIVARLALGVAVLGLGGCPSDGSKNPGSGPDAKENLSAGYAALQQQQFDQALGRADAHLRANPQPAAGSAEALYLKGRALEARVAQNPQEAAANLAQARAAYVQALALNPPQPLEAYVRTSLANVCYFQDDYASAVNEWAQAYEKLDNPELRAWTLYRIGLSQQRMGRFDVADRTFAAVQQQYPNTVPAQRSRERQGARAFAVQVATYSQPQLADQAVQTLRQKGLAPNRAADPQGRTVITVGPVPTYQQAQQLKTRVADAFPDALIVP